MKTLTTEVKLKLCHFQNGHYKCFKGRLLALRQFLTFKSLLKVIKNAFHLILNALFVLEMFIFMSWHCGSVRKRLHKKVTVNFKTYDITHWTINNYNAQFTNISRNQAITFGQLKIFSKRNIFLQKWCRKMGRDTSCRPVFCFLKKL